MNPTDPLRRRVAASLALAPLAASLPAFAQATLPKSITFLVPQAAGGSNDVIARSVAVRLPQVIGSNVVVENRPGAGGNVGSAWVAKSAPKDGSVFLVTVNSAQAVNPTLYRSTGFDDLGGCVDFLVEEKVWTESNKKINTKGLVPKAMEQMASVWMRTTVVAALKAAD